MGIFRLFRYLRILGCLGVIGLAAIGLFADGIARRQRAADDMSKYRQPTTLTCDEFVRRKPTSGWFRVTDCASDATDATFIVTTYDHNDDDKARSHTDISEVVLPVYGKSDDTDVPAHVAVVANNPALCSIVNDMDKEGFFETKPVHDDSAASTDSSDTSGADKSGDSTDASAASDKKNAKADKKADDADEQHMVAFVKKNLDRIATVRTIEGMVRNLDDLDSDQRKALAHNSDHFAPRYLLLVEGESPTGNASSASIESGAGFVIILVIGLIFTAMGLAAFGRRGGGGSGGGGTPYARPTYIPPTGGTATGPFYNPPGGPTGGPANTPPAGQNPWTPTPPPVIYPPVAPPTVPQTPRQPSQPWSLD